MVIMNMHKVFEMFLNDLENIVKEDGIDRNKMVEKSSDFVRNALPNHVEIMQLDKKYWIYPKDEFVKIIKQNKIDIRDYRSDRYDCPVGEDTAYAFGLFFADGSCSLKNDTYSGACLNIVNTEKDLLKKAKRGMEEIPDTEELYWEINEYPSEAKGEETNYGKRNKGLKHLEVKTDGYGVRGEFIEWMRNLFYFNDLKRVPAPLIEESPYTEQLEFLKGVYDGDGTKDKGVIDVDNKLAITELSKIMEDLGWDYHIEKYQHRNAFKLWFSKYDWEKGKILRHLEKNGKSGLTEISKNINSNNSTVRKRLKDLQRKNIVKLTKPWEKRLNAELTDRHACENFAMSFKADVDERFSNQVGLVIDYEAGHAYNVIVWKDGSFDVFEPQNDEFIDDYNQGNFRFTEGHTAVLI